MIFSFAVCHTLCFGFGAELIEYSISLWDLLSLLKIVRRVTMYRNTLCGLRRCLAGLLSLRRSGLLRSGILCFTVLRSKVVDDTVSLMNLRI